METRPVATPTATVRVAEISGTAISFEDTIRVGMERATQSRRGVTSGWVKEQEVEINHLGRITEYKVNLLVTSSFE